MHFRLPSTPDPSSPELQSKAVTTGDHHIPSSLLNNAADTLRSTTSMNYNMNSSAMMATAAPPQEIRHLQHPLTTRSVAVRVAATNSILYLINTVSVHCCGMPQPLHFLLGNFLPRSSISISLSIERVRSLSPGVIFAAAEKNINNNKAI